MTKKEIQEIYKQWEKEDIDRNPIIPTKANIKDILGEKLEKSFLYDYQKDLILKAKKVIDINDNNVYLYKTDVGTGKTFMAIHHYLINKNDGVRLLLVLPSAKIEEFGWENSIRFVETKYNIKIEYSIISYDKFKALKEAPKNYFVVFDEAHKFKNWKGGRYKTIKKIKHHFKGLLCLSATPYSEDMHLIPYFDIFNIVDEISKYVNAKKVMSDFGKYQSNMGIKPFIVGLRNIENEKYQLEGVYSSKFLTRNECNDLPPIEEITIYIDKPTIVNKFDIFKKDNLIELTKLFLEEDVDIEDIDLSIIEDIKKIIPTFNESNFLSTMGLSVTERQLTIVNKIDYVKMLREESNSNIIIFYNFNSERDMIYNKLKNCDWEGDIYELNGQTNNIPSNHSNIKNSTCLIQYRSGGEAIELKFADTVIFLSPTYSYQDLYQATGRCYRNGQTNKVRHYYLLTTDTIEQDIYDIIIKKQRYIYNVDNLVKKYKSNKQNQYKFIL